MSKPQMLETVVQINGVMSESVRKSVQDVKRQFGLIDGKAIETAKKIAAIGAAAATAAAGMAAAFVKKGSDISRTMNGIAAQTGATGEQLAEFKDIALDIYESGKGESLQGIADALVNIRQASGLAGDELKAAAESAVLLKDTFNMETEETTRAATALMKNFGIEAKEAYGLIAVGAQNGANKNGDLLDTLNEYSVHYKALGFTANEFVDSLIKGAEAGAFSVDKVGDAIKEFTIRSKDGSKTSAEGFKTLGLDAETMTAQFAAGGRVAQAAFAQTMKALNEMEDPVKKNAAGVALFGTQFEDLEAGAIQALSNMSGAAIDGEKTLRDLEKVKYNDLGYAISQIGRSFETALIPSAEAAGQAVFAAMPQIKESVAQVTPYIAAIGEAFAAALPGIIQGIGEAAQSVYEFGAMVADNWGMIEPVLMTAAGAFAAIKLVTFTKNMWLATQAVIANTTAAWGQIRALNAKLVAQLKDKVVTAQIIGLYAKDAVAKGLSTAKTAALTVATKTWTVASKAAALAARGLGAAFKVMTGPVGWAVAGISAAVAAGVWLYKNWDTVKEKAAEVGAWVSEKWSGMGEAVSDAVGALGSWLSDKWASIKATALNAAKALGAGLSERWAAIKGSVSDAASALGDSLSEKWSSIKDAVANTVAAMGDSLSEKWTAMRDVATSAAQALADGLSNTWTGIKSFVSETAAGVAAGVANAWTSIQTKTAELFATFSTQFPGIKATALNAAKALGAGLSERWAAIKGSVSDAASALGDSLSEKWSSIKDAVANTVAAMGDSLSEKWTAMRDVATSAAQALADGLSNTWTGIKSFVSETAAGVAAGVANAWTSIQTKTAELFATFSTQFPGIANVVKNWWTMVNGIIDSVIRGFSNVIGFVKNVFTGQWSAAWDNVRGIFAAAFDGLAIMLKAPINGVITLINKAIGGINGIGFTVPDWVPGIGGKAFEVNVPTVPMLAKGGFTTGPSIAGEAGTEAVISFDPAVREQNVGYLVKAAGMLGLEVLDKKDDRRSLSYYAERLDSAGGGDSLSTTTNTTTINLGGVTFAPTVTVAGTAEKKENIIEQLRNYEGDLLDLIEELLASKEAANYGASGVF